MSDLSDVRLLISDVDESIFTDAQITSFLTLSGDSVFLASATALRSMASNAALLAKKEKSMNYEMDRKTVFKALLDTANAFEKRVTDGLDGEVGFDIAERGYTGFNYEDIAVNKALREQ